MAATKNSNTATQVDYFAEIEAIANQAAISLTKKDLNSKLA